MDPPATSKPGNGSGMEEALTIEEARKASGLEDMINKLRFCAAAQKEWMRRMGYTRNEEKSSYSSLDDRELARGAKSVEEIIDRAEGVKDAAQDALITWGRALDKWGSAATSTTELLEECQEALKISELALVDSRAILFAAVHPDEMKGVLLEALECLELARETIETLEISLEDLRDIGDSSQCNTSGPPEPLEKVIDAIKTMKSLLEIGQGLLPSRRYDPKHPGNYQVLHKDAWVRIQRENAVASNLLGLFESMKGTRKASRVQAESWTPFRDSDRSGHPDANAVPPKIWELQVQSEISLEELVQEWKALVKSVYEQLERKAEQEMMQQKEYSHHVKLVSSIREWRTLKRQIEGERRKSRSRKVLNDYWQEWVERSS